MSNKKHIVDLFLRYVLATLGLLLIAFAESFAIKSNTGTSPLTSIPYAVHLWKNGLSVGQCVIALHTTLLFVQIILLRKNFKLSSLMQIPAALTFGFLLDLCIWITSANVIPENYYLRLLLAFLSALVAAIGICLEIYAGAWMLSGDCTNAAISKVSGMKFSNVKISLDFTLVGIAALICLVVFSNPLGRGKEFVIREGTIILSLFTGLFIKFFKPAVDKFFKRYL